MFPFSPFHNCLSRQIALTFVTRPYQMSVSSHRIYSYSGQARWVTCRYLRLTETTCGQAAKADKARYRASAPRHGVAYPLIGNWAALLSRGAGKEALQWLATSAFACSGITAAVSNPVTWTRGGLVFRDHWSVNNQRQSISRSRLALSSKTTTTCSQAE